MTFSVDTSFDTAALASRLEQACMQAAEQVGHAVIADCEPYVPYDTGLLCRSVRCGAAVRTEVGWGCDVIWSAPYASAVYHADARGVRFRTEHHTLAQARWFDAAQRAHGEDWTELVRGCVGEQF